MKILLAILIFYSLDIQAQVKIPARVEAEGWSSNRNVVTITLDSSKGLTYKTGSWASYSVSVSQAGTYIMRFKIGDGSGGAVTKLLRSDGSTFGRFVTPSTGGLLNFSIISDTVFFPAGKQTFRVSDSAGEYNMDWFEVYLLPTAPAPVVTYATQSEVDSLLSIINILRVKVDSNYIKADPRVFGWTTDSLFTIPSLLPSIKKKVVALKKKRQKKK